MTKLDRAAIMREEAIGRMSRKQMAEHFGTSEQYLSKVIKQETERIKVEADPHVPEKLAAIKAAEKYRDGEITFEEFLCSSGVIMLHRCGEEVLPMCFGSDWVMVIEKTEAEYRPVEQAEW